MVPQVKTRDFSDQNIFVGLDVHRNSWRVSFHLGAISHKTIHMAPASVEALERYLHKHYPGGQYQCAYEAGFSGFWLQRALAARGIETLVIHPADVPTTDKERQQKDDVRDSRKIARSLRNGELEGITIIGEMEEAHRQLVRYRWQLAADRRRVMQRIKSHLYFTGPVPEEMQQSGWSRAYMAWLHQRAEKDAALGFMVKEYELIRDLEREQMKQLRSLFKSDRYAKEMELLRSVPGVGFLSAMLIMTEIGDIQRFSSCDKLAFYAGLVPGTDSSGDSERAHQRTKRGNKRLRTTLIECAWAAVKQDEELALAYITLKKRMDAPHAIIKIARRLLNRIRKVWLSGVEYVPPAELQRDDVK